MVTKLFIKNQNPCSIEEIYRQQIKEMVHGLFDQNNIQNASVLIRNIEDVDWGHKKWYCICIPPNASNFFASSQL